MTLKAKLIASIGSSGTIPVSDYMTACLFDREFGYYQRRDAIGAQGAFTTAPEISQMFGELIGIFLVNSWREQGSPRRFTLAELGPGRATMMDDILRVAGRFESFLSAAELIMVEQSPALRDVQRQKLSGHHPQWIDTLDMLPEQPLFLVANEFFDALPIRQFRRRRCSWKEIHVAADGDALEFQEVDSEGDSALRQRHSDTRPGDIVEIRHAAIPLLEQISSRIRQFGGVALLSDYGGERSWGDTLQAVSNHHPVHPLAEPGESDISAHVDFGALRNAVGDGVSTALLPQGVWLEGMGLVERARILAERLEGEALRQHIAAQRRLTHPAEMGELYKVLLIRPSHAPLPPGFEN